MAPKRKGEVFTGQAAGCLVKIKVEYQSTEFIRKTKQIQIRKNRILRVAQWSTQKSDRPMNETELYQSSIVGLGKTIIFEPLLSLTKMG